MSRPGAQGAVTQGFFFEIFLIFFNLQDQIEKWLALRNLTLGKQSSIRFQCPLVQVLGQNIVSKTCILGNEFVYFFDQVLDRSKTGQPTLVCFSLNV